MDDMDDDQRCKRKPRVRSTLHMLYRSLGGGGASICLSVGYRFCARARPTAPPSVRHKNTCQHNIKPTPTANNILPTKSARRLLDRRYLDHHRRRCRRRSQHLILGTVATARAAVTCSRFFFYFCVLDKSHRLLFHFSIAFQTTFKRPHLGGGTQGILPGLSASGRVDGGEAAGGLPRHGNDSFLALYSFRLLIHGPPRQRPR